MAAKMQNDSYSLCGAMQFDEQNESAAALLAKFMDAANDILEAIISAFGYSPYFTNHFNFGIAVSQIERSRTDKVQLVSHLLTELVSRRGPLSMFRLTRPFAFIAGGGGRRGKQFSTPLEDHVHVSKAGTSMSLRVMQ